MTGFAQVGVNDVVHPPLGLLALQALAQAPRLVLALCGPHGVSSSVGDPDVLTQAGPARADDAGAGRYPEPRADRPPSERLGGMALANGLLVHDPKHWAPATLLYRAPTGGATHGGRYPGARMNPGFTRGSGALPRR